MKYKDVLRNSLYLDEELQDYFNEMSKKGWRLDFVGYYYRFIKDEHVYKYQIDYTPISSEYQDILKEMGYHEVRNSFDDFRVLENENVDAPDLNTEFVFDKNNKMKQFKKIRYFIYPILAYFLFWLGKIFIKDIVEIGKPVLYYEGFGSLLMGIVFIVLSFVLLFVTILNFSILYALKNDKDLKSLKKLNSIKDHLSILFYILLVISGVFYLLKSFITLDLKVKAGENGKIFGGITAKEISQELKSKQNMDIDKKKIVLKETIKNIGRFSVDIKFGEGINAKLTVDIQPE